MQEQYVMTTTRHEFLLPEGFCCRDWSWRRFRAGGSGGGEGRGASGRGGTHVLEVTFYEESEDIDELGEERGSGEELAELYEKKHLGSTEQHMTQAHMNRHYQEWREEQNIHEETMDMDIDSDKWGSDLLVFD